MAQLRPNYVGLALVLLIVFQSASAIDKCKTGCDGPSGPFKFTPGTTYKYDYDGKINILVSTAEGEQTTTEVKATVLLTQQADCSQILRLQNVQIVGPDGKKRSGIPNIDKPVVLNNNNGALNDFMCTDPGDNQNSLNLKRAIASLFQANLEKSTEVDVFGQCPTHISKSVDGDITTIHKNKNLNKCAFRESITNDYLSSTFNIQSEIQASPILNSILDSKQKLKAGVLDSANVVENYLFVPFSIGQNGAKATVESKLTLTGTSKDIPSVKCSVPKSIIFENPHPVNLAKTNMNTILKSVKTLSENLGDVVQDKAATNFIGLVKLLRVSKKPDILSVYNQIRSGSGFTDKEAIKQLFLDAVLAAGTGDTIEVAIELLKNKELSPMEERQLFSGLPRARHVTENSIKTATDLLNRANLPKEAYLGVGALAGRYCTHHKCEKVDVINKIIQKLLSKLGDLKAANRKEENDMIFVLKGLTNIGFLNDAILSKLVTLAEDKKQPARLRVATLEAYKAAPCKDKLRDSALKVLKDTQQDSEIRIKAYLVLTVCPNEKIGNAIKTLLENEKSYQVGGYISTHLRNLRSSINPDKALARAHLGFVRASNKFPFDPRKYSYNSEFSYFIDSIGVADNVEADVIYSQNSFLPRSLNLNLTSEVFGHRFHYLELAARQENLERVMEHYLGPQGVLRKATLQQNYDNMAKPIANLLKNLKEKVDKSLRARRDVSKADIDAINKKIQIKANELDKNLDIDLSVKTFGNEVVFMNSFDITEKLSPQGIIDGLVNKLNDGLNSLKSFEKVLRLNLLFLDAELSYPTSLGFPLRLGVDGAANVQIKTSGNIDVRDIISESPDNDINLKISLIPSAAVSVIGRFTLDTPLIENGLKVGSTLHTSSGGDIEVKTFNAAKGLDVKFSVPVQKQELIGLRHSIIYQTKENGVVTNKNIRFTQNKDFSICVDQLSQFIGLEFCADINGPNLSGKKVPVLPFPLSGNARLSVRIERGDIDTIHYRREFISKEGKIGVEANLETLRNGNQKAASVNVEAYLSPEKYIKVNLNSPIKNAEGEARLVFNDKEKILLLSVKDESKVLYSAKAGLQVDGGADKTIYNPILQYTTPQNQAPQTPPFHVEGKVIAVKTGNDIKYTLDGLTFVIPNRKSIVITGNLGTEGPAYYSDLTASDGTISGSLGGRLETQKDVLKVQAEMKNSLKPTLNFNVKGEFKKQENPDLISSNLQITHGPDLQSKTNVLTLINSLSVKNPKDPKTLEITTKNKITYPLAKLNGKFDMEKGPKSLHYDTSIQYGDIKFGSELKLKINTKTVGDYQMELDAYDLKNKLEVRSSRQVVGPDDSKISNSIGLNNKKLEIGGKVKHRVRPGDLNVGGDLTVKVPNNKTPLKVNGQVKINPREFDTHLKILAGKTSIIDLLLKGNRVGDINGHAKVNLKDTLTVDGQVSSKKGVGKGNAVIDFKQLKKTTKLDATFTIQRPKYNLNLNFYPVFNEDPKKKISIDTNNEISGTTIHSKTNLDLLGNQFALNGNAQLGNLLNGKTTADVDLSLPGPLYLSGQFARDAKTKDGSITGETTISLGQSTDKATPGRKITIKTVTKDTNIKEGVVDVTVNFAADNAAGKNVNMDLSLKRQKSGDKRILNFSNKITSSDLSSPIEASYNAEYSKTGGNVELKASIDPKANLQLNGKFSGDTSAGQKTGSVSVNLALPSEMLSNVKTSYNLAIKPPQGTSPGTLDLSGNLQTISNVPNLNIETSGSINLQGDKTSGKISVHEEVKKPCTLTIDGSGGFNMDPEKKTGSINGNLKVILPNKNVIQGSGTLTRISPKEYNLEASLDLPTKAHKSNKLTVHTKRSDKNDISSQATLESDGQKHTVNTELSLNPLDSKVDIQMICPDGKLSQISANLQRPSSDRMMGNIKILSQGKDFILEGGIDVNNESPDNIYLQLTGNCPKLNINDVVFKVGGNTNPDKNTVSVLLTSAGKNVISGDAKISNRQEQGKNIIEGSGDFKVGTENKSGNFKYIRTVLTSDKNGENGNEISFDATIGTKAIDAELKITDKEFRYLYSFCEASKQCAHVEIDAKTTTNEIARYDGQIEVTIDLRVLGLPTEFGLKSVTHRDHFLLDHTVDVHFENAANKYQYSLSIHPSQFEISLTTPNRVISLEGTATLPSTNLKNGGKASGEIAFYTDKKNNPNTKSSLTGNVNVDVQKRTIDAEAQLNIVNMKKPFIIKYTKTVPKPDLASSGSQKLIVDIFATPDQKIIATQTYSIQYDKNTHKTQAQNAVSVKSTGLSLDVAINHNALLDPKALTASLKASGVFALSQNKYENLLKLAASTKDASLLIKILNNVILDIQSNIAFQKGQIDVNSQVNGLGFEPIEADLQIKNYNSVTLTRFLKNNPNDKLVVKAAVTPGQTAEAVIEQQTGGATKPLLQLSIDLSDKNFLKPTFNVQGDQLKELSSKIRTIAAKQLEQTADKVKESAAALKNDGGALLDKAKNSIPDATPSVQFYQKEAATFKQELAADKTLQNLAQLMDNVLNTVISVVSKVVSAMSNIVGRTIQAVVGAVTDVLSHIKTALLPKLQALAQALLESAKNILDKLVDIAANLIVKGVEILKAIEPQLEVILSSVAEILEDVMKAIVATLENIKNTIIQQLKHLQQELKSSPIISELKAQYQDIIKNGLPSQDAIVNTIRAFFGALRELVPLPELQQILDQTEQYLEKRLTNKPVDDVVEIRRIGGSILQLATKVSGAIAKEIVPEILKSSKLPGVNFDLLRGLPSVGTARISVVNYLLREDVTPLVRFLLRLIVTPRDFIIPGELSSIVALSEVFTFDGRILYLPGDNCNYLLAADAVNGNFSIVGTYQNKIFSAVTLTDKTGSLTLTKDKLLLDNVEVDIPVQKGNLRAYRTKAFYYLESRAGVQVLCEINLLGCDINVSGFYRGQLRGLLGNGNNEPHDDGTLPNGKIVDKLTEIASAYAVGAQCAPVQMKEIDEPKSDPECEKMFDYESPLRLCYPFVDRKPAKRACDYAAAQGDKDIHRMIGSLYSYLCYKSNIPVEMPASISEQCTNSLAPRKVDEQFNIQLPGKSADVLLLVSTDKDNEALYTEYGQSLMTAITNEFKAKGIDDVVFHSIAYGGANQQPSFVTVGGLTSFKDKAPAFKFSESPKPQKLVTGITDLDRVIGFIRTVIHDLKSLLGLTLESNTYTDAINYPFRVEAIRTTVAITSDPCEHSLGIPVEVAKTILFNRKDININLIAPTKDFKVKDPQTTKGVIGFTSENVITLSEAAAKPTGSPTLQKSMTYNDLCSDYTVGVGGNVFVSTNLLANKDKKDQISQIVAKNIVSSATSRKIQLECSCAYSFKHPVNPYNHCKPVDIKEA
ncbi:apolipophorins-like isoform X2 [Coccinella septempunctata]|uniref:apolipophorins-like isoform X1 n=1 Tax=Coccinella septempunctata TaxID=41139 RepID=UPI001D067ADE|nr:apolipophorins-like isoform X1 [Coccinella septempunctata]XP_044763303.1 apolipophorins-like isoform X2 [Coccinella septempunctata]